MLSPRASTSPRAAGLTLALPMPRARRHSQRRSSSPARRCGRRLCHLAAPPAYRRGSTSLQVVEWLIASPHCSLADLREAAALASRLEKRRTTADAARVAALLRASSSLRLRGGFARCIAPRPSPQAAAPPRASPRAVLPDAPEEDDGVSAPPPSEGDDLGDFGLRRGLGVAVDAVLPTRLVRYC